MISQSEHIKIFSRLGAKLREGIPSEVIERAIAENEWFSEDDVKYAIQAIAEDLLEKLSTFNFQLSTNSFDIAIIMAGNIPAVGFADLLYVLLAGHNAYIKPSHKDRALIEYIVSLLSELPVYMYDDTRNYDGIIATGGESANLYFRQKFADTPSIFRSSRSSVAVLTGKETGEQLRDLSDDIFRYSGMGCRSVSLLFVPQSTDMEQLASKIKPEGVHPKYATNYRYTRASLIAQGVDFTDGSNFVMVENDSFPSSISQINYVRYNDPKEVEQWLSVRRNELQCIIGQEVPFGRAQHPTLTDYADGIDVIKWFDELITN